MWQLCDRGNIVVPTSPWCPGFSSHCSNCLQFFYSSLECFFGQIVCILHFVCGNFFILFCLFAVNDSLEIYVGLPLPPRTKCCTWRLPFRGWTLDSGHLSPVITGWLQRRATIFRCAVGRLMPVTWWTSMIYLICSASAISLVWTAIKRVDHHSIKFTKVTGVESVSGKGEGVKYQVLGNLSAPFHYFSAWKPR